MLINISFRTKLATLLILVLSSCGGTPEPKNEFEKAVYTDSRPSADKKSDRYRKPSEVLSFMGISEGMVVADISAGGGYYTELMSIMVGNSGTVFYHNKPEWAKKEKNKKKIGSRVSNNRLANVNQVIGSLVDFKLSKKADILVLSKMFHDLYVPDSSPERDLFINQFMANLASNLKPNGKVLLIDHSAKEGSNTDLTATTHRIDPDFVKQVFADAGFKLLSSASFLKNSDDDLTKNIWESNVFPNTDRFIMLFQKQ